MKHIFRTLLIANPNQQQLKKIGMRIKRIQRIYTDKKTHIIFFSLNPLDLPKDRDKLRSYFFTALFYFFAVVPDGVSVIDNDI
jgi:hypothetical protein